jgi:lysyl-tRNA synthetase class 2
MDAFLDDIQHAYDQTIQVPGKELAFLILIAFLCSFGFIRTSAHMIRAQVSWWPGNVETKGGTHIHHLVWGILLILVFGYVGIAVTEGSPWEELAAILFGVGMGLTLDEFALWLNLKDVYWAEQGRESIDAVIVATTLILLTLLGLTLWVDAWKALLVLLGLMGDTISGVETQVVLLPWHGLGLLFGTVALLKHKPMTAVIGLVVPLVSLVGAIRLAKPQSWWARRFYDEDKHRRARERHKGEPGGPPRPTPAAEQTSA